MYGIIHSVWTINSYASFGLPIYSRTFSILKWSNDIIDIKIWLMDKLKHSKYNTLIIFKYDRIYDLTILNLQNINNFPYYRLQFDPDYSMITNIYLNTTFEERSIALLYSTIFYYQEIFNWFKISQSLMINKHFSKREYKKKFRKIGSKINVWFSSKSRLRKYYLAKTYDITMSQISL